MGLKGRELDVAIRGLTLRGNGLGDADLEDGRRLTVEVPFCAPGDRVKARFLGKRKGMVKGQLLSVEDAAETRIEPRCRHFGTCGGCRWQHIDYAQQLSYKEEQIKRCFGDHLGDAVVHPIVPADPPWRYRNKMEFSFAATRGGDRFLGLVMDGAYRDVFNTEECHLCSEWMSDALRAVRGWWDASGVAAYNIRNGTGTLRTLTLREAVASGDRMVILTVSGSVDFALGSAEIESFLSACSAIAPSGDGQLSVVLRLQQTEKGMATSFVERVLSGPDHLREELSVPVGDTKHAVRFRISPTAFFQPNPAQAARLYGLAVERAGIRSGDVVFDLYCGTGSLGLCAAPVAKSVTGIELSPTAVDDARRNVDNNGFGNMEIVCGDVGRELSRLRAEDGFVTPDVVMVDPPRAGLDATALEHLAQLKARRIVYVSCNPVTQAENVAVLTTVGYRLSALQAVDQFPHTAHVENIAVLERV